MNGDPPYEKEGAMVAAVCLAISLAIFGFFAAAKGIEKANADIEASKAQKRIAVALEKMAGARAPNYPETCEYR